MMFECVAESLKSFDLPLGDSVFSVPTGQRIRDEFVTFFGL
jgi:hypothetical protein